MSRITLENLGKAYRGGIVAVRDFNLVIPDGSLAVILGPSGCGKTTLLRLIAGLARPTAGRVLIDGVDAAGLAPPRRNVSMVFQSAAVYPHLTVRGNLEFPLRQRRAARAETHRRADEVAALLAIATLMDRRSDELSGGERQRVALARALITRPAACLLDEPLAHLDAPLRLQMQAELIALQRRLGMTMISVTHDQTEAVSMSDLLVVMAPGGRVQQVGPPDEILRKPANRFVAGFVGLPPMSFIEGRITSKDGRLLFADGAGFEMQIPMALPGQEGSVDRKVVLGVRSTGIRLCELQAPEADHMGDSLENLATVTIERLMRLGEQLFATLTTSAGARITARVDADHVLTPGQSWRCTIDTSLLSIFEPGEFGARLS